MLSVFYCHLSNLEHLSINSPILEPPVFQCFLAYGLTQFLTCIQLETKKKLLASQHLLSSLFSIFNEYF